LVYEPPDLLHLPLADVRRGRDAVERLGHARGDVGAGRVGEEFELVEPVLEVVVGLFGRLYADEDGGFAGGSPEDGGGASQMNRRRWRDGEGRGGRGRPVRGPQARRQ